MNRQPHPVDLHIGRLIRARRHACGLTQPALALACGITFQQIQKYENGSNRVSGSRLQQIAGVLGVAPAQFFEGLPEGGGAPDVAAVSGSAFLASRRGAELAGLWPALREDQQEALLGIARMLATMPKPAASRSIALAAALEARP